MNGGNAPVFMSGEYAGLVASSINDRIFQWASVDDDQIRGQLKTAAKLKKNRKLCTYLKTIHKLLYVCYLVTSK